MELPLDRSRGIALARKLKFVSPRGGLEEFEKRLRLMGNLADVVEFFCAHDDDLFSALLRHSLRAIGPHPPE